MSIPFPTEAWIKALMAELNRSDAYREAAQRWEGDVYFVVSGPGGGAETVMYMDLWHGECREAVEVRERGARTPEFTLEAPLATWRRVLEKQLDPIQGIATKQLKLTGPLMKVLRMPRAATALVECGALIDTAWPE